MQQFIKLWDILARSELYILFLSSWFNISKEKATVYIWITISCNYRNSKIRHQSLPQWKTPKTNPVHIEFIGNLVAFKKKRTLFHRLSWNIKEFFSCKQKNCHFHKLFSLQTLSKLCHITPGKHSCTHC